MRAFSRPTSYSRKLLVGILDSNAVELAALYVEAGPLYLLLGQAVLFLDGR